MKQIAIIGAGISGLATAFQIEKKLKESGIDHKVHIFEREPKVGGKISAVFKNGFRCEAGPNGFLDSKPSTLQLCEELGLSDKLLRSTDAARKRFIYSQGKLHELPTSPPKFFFSGLLSLKGRIRIIGELWAPGPKQGTDPTIAEFARRRLGEEAHAKLLDPMVAGVFAGDTERLSLESCFPRMAELERDYGSLIKAMIKIQKERKKDPAARKKKDKGGPAGPGGTLTSFRDGLSVLPQAIADRFKGRITCNSDLKKIEKTARGFRLSFPGAEDFECDCVVAAAPACDTASPLAHIDEGLTAVLNRFEFAPATVVGLGFDKNTIKHDINGFGFLIPKKEHRRILGSLWTSSIFPHRAPEGSVLLRTIVGGARSPELAILPEEEIIAMVRDELKAIMGITAEPTFVQAFKWEKAICQYTVGHKERLQEVDERVSRIPGLFLTGNSYRGVALNDCTLNATRIAEKVARFFA
ncbi:MAG: protoporphyrinogen oxidase [Deltaproteobacteria bacterium]|nr:protoporphyrinogen oxidase [Deltaproteobacteria bacterium]